MAILHDKEFGKITLRRFKLAKSIRLKVDQKGKVSISLPLRTPLYLAKRLLEDSRERLRVFLTGNVQNGVTYVEGEQIGLSHTLHYVAGNDYKSEVQHGRLIVIHPVPFNQLRLSETLKEGVQKSLRIQAKSYLPSRVRQTALANGFQYKKLRFSTASTRWGSCSSKGTISLNIWLMTLPERLIEYVIIHELCHTKKMNHSKEFWELVGSIEPNYRTLRSELRLHSPNSQVHK